MGIYFDENNRSNDYSNVIEQLKSERTLSGRKLPVEEKLILPTKVEEPTKQEKTTIDSFEKLNLKGLTFEQVQEAINSYVKDLEIIDDKDNFYC